MSLQNDLPLIDADDIAKVSSTMVRVQATQQVSKSDVQRILNHLPITHNLDDFDEEPSGRNVTIALESMAGFLKIGLAVVVVGVVGYVIYNLIANRKKAEKISEDNLAANALFKATNSLRNEIIQANLAAKGLKDSAGRGFLENVNEFVFGGNTFDEDLEREGARIFCQSHYDSLPPFGVLANLDQYSEILSQEEVVRELRACLRDVGEQIQRGQSDKIIKTLNDLVEKFSPTRLCDHLKSNFGDALRSTRKASGQSTATYFGEIAEALNQVYDSKEENVRINVGPKIRESIIGLTTGGREFPLTERELVGDISRSLDTVKRTQGDAEKIREMATTMHLSEDVSQAVHETLEHVEFITKGAGKLYEVVGAETLSARRHAEWLAGIYMKVAERSVEILKNNNESSQANRIAKAAKELAKLAKNVK